MCLVKRYAIRPHSEVHSLNDFFIISQDAWVNMSHVLECFSTIFSRLLNSVFTSRFTHRKKKQKGQCFVRACLL